jgi:hypothetical protein
MRNLIDTLNATVSSDTVANREDKLRMVKEDLGNKDIKKSKWDRFVWISELMNNVA